MQDTDVEVDEDSIPDEDGKSAKDYQASRDRFSPEFIKAVDKKLVSIVDNLLLHFGDPRNYAEYCNFARWATVMMTAYIATNDWIQLSEKATASEEHIAKVVAKREAAEAREKERSSIYDQLVGSGSATALDNPPPTGAYL